MADADLNTGFVIALMAGFFSFAAALGFFVWWNS